MLEFDFNPHITSKFFILTLQLILSCPTTFNNLIGISWGDWVDLLAMESTSWANTFYQLTNRGLNVVTSSILFQVQCTICTNKNPLCFMISSSYRYWIDGAITWGVFMGNAQNFHISIFGLLSSIVLLNTSSGTFILFTLYELFSMYWF